MPKSRTIRVTPNVKECLKILKEAARALESGDLKKKAQSAVNYLDSTFKGEHQPKKGYLCPGNTLIIKK